MRKISRFYVCEKCFFRSWWTSLPPTYLPTHLPHSPYIFITLHSESSSFLARAFFFFYSLIYEKTLKVMARFRVILIFALCCFSLASQFTMLLLLLLLLILHFHNGFFSFSPFPSIASSRSVVAFATAVLLYWWGESTLSAWVIFFCDSHTSLLLTPHCLTFLADSPLPSFLTHSLSLYLSSSHILNTSKYYEPRNSNTNIVKNEWEIGC